MAGEAMMEALPAWCETIWNLWLQEPWTPPWKRTTGLTILQTHQKVKYFWNQPRMSIHLSSVCTSKQSLSGRIPMWEHEYLPIQFKIKLYWKWKWNCSVVSDSLQSHGSSVHGIFQARILEWVAISFSRGSSQPRDWTQVSLIAGRCFNLWATTLHSHQILAGTKYKLPSEFIRVQWAPDTRVGILYEQSRKHVYREALN